MTEQNIGERLRTARESAGLTRDDVHYRTRLPKSVIASLEDEDFASFASPVYARSFLAQYSEFLQVDADLWLDALEPGGYVIGGVVASPIEAPGDVAERSVPREAGASHGGWFAMPLLMLFSAGLVVAAVKGYAYFETKFRSEPSVPAEASPPPQVSEPAPPATGTDTGIMPRPAGEALADEPPPRAVIVR